MAWLRTAPFTREDIVQFTMGPARVIQERKARSRRAVQHLVALYSGQQIPVSGEEEDDEQVHSGSEDMFLQDSEGSDEVIN